MADSPRFSVTIPAYNAQDTLAETVGSVLSQDHESFEVVIVDDGSTDGTLALARELAAADPRIIVVAQENRGSGGAYNTAVRTARADLLVMLSADDLLEPGHLAEMDRLIGEHPDASVFTCDGWYLDESGHRTPVDAARDWADPHGATLEELLRACFFGVGAVYRRTAFDAVGGFREDLYAEDYLFWLMALARGFTHRHLDRRLAVHRRGSAQKSANAIRMRETDVAVIQALIDSGLIEGDPLQAASRAMGRLSRRVAARKVAAAVLGPDAAERLVESIRSRRGGSERR